MSPRRWWPPSFAVVGALVQLVLWLLVRPDLAGPQWSDGYALEVWLAVEAAAAHFAWLGAHHDGTLWAVGLFGEALLASVAVGLALQADRLTRRG